MNILSIWKSDWSPDRSDMPPVDTDFPLLSVDEAQRVADYLRAGTVLLRSTHLLPDQLDDDPAPRVPISSRTDGSWVWDDAVLYYVEKYRISPGDKFVEYCRARDFLPREATAAEVEQAQALLLL